MTGIVTVTLAPAIDLTYRADAVVPGAVNRATAVTRELSGKGVNVSYAVALSGVATRAVLPMGEADAAEAREEWLSPVAAAERTRVNVTMATADGVTTKLNSPTSPLSAAELSAIVERAIAETREIGAEWVVVAGSVPPLAGGGSVDLGGVVDALASDTDARVVVDTSGPALERVFAESLPSLALVKPNTHELAEAIGRPLATIGEVREAASALVGRGCETVYVSMGEDGALAVTAGGSWWARAAPAGIVNATGAGDASLAGFLVAGSERARPSFDVAAAIAGAARYGALSVSQASTLLADLGSAPPADVVADPDPGIRLADPAA